MNFVLSKVLWFVTNPGNVFLILLVIATVLTATRWRTGGVRLIWLLAVVGTFVAVAPVGTWMVGKLENRFPTVVSVPADIDGVVVLGGMVDQFTTQARGQPTLGDGVERITEMIAIGRRHPDATLVFSGGSGDLVRQDVKEASVVRLLLTDLGFPLSRVRFEEHSRNTFENALYTKDMVGPKPGEKWLLITSAFHMPRAVGCFRKVGWDVIPYPVDYSTDGATPYPGFDFAGGLGRLSRAVHEWLGLGAYFLMGRTDALYPGPRETAGG